MGQVLQVNGDYTIKARGNAGSPGGREARITLDTGASNGEVKVIGNLIVEGSTVTVDTSNLAIDDNIIVLNRGEAGPGVTKEVSGIEIDRGPTTNRAAFYYDEFDDSWSIAQRSSSIAEAEVNRGSYTFTNSKLKVSEILTNLNSNLILIGSGTGVVNVGNRNPSNSPLIAHYEDLVLDDDDIPNRRFVLDAIQGQPARQIISDADPGGSPSRIIISDADVNDTDKDGTVVTESEIAVFIDDQELVTFYIDRIEFTDLVIKDNELGQQRVDQNIVLKTLGVGKIEIPYGIQMLQVTSLDLPGVTSGSLNLQARSPDAGNTGLFFVHSNEPLGDELISKRKALVFSMLF